MSGHLTSFAIIRTGFVTQTDRGLRQVVKVQVDNSSAPAEGVLSVDVAGQVETVELGIIERGLGHYEITVPEVSSATQAAFVLRVGGVEATHQTLLLPVRHWKVYLVPFSHHDLGYTDLPEVCIQQHRDYFRRIIDYCRQTDDFPEEARFRWTADTTWAVKFFLEDASDRDRADFLDFVRDGRIEITAQYAAFNSALLTHEELIRSIYYAFELAREHNLEITSAMTTDIPGNPWGFAQVLARSGVRYLSTAVNRRWAQDGVDRAKVPRISRPFYWAGPDGSEVLVWNTDPEHIYVEGRELGLTTSFDAAHRNLPGYLQSLEAGGYPYDAISLRTTCKTADNAPPCVYLSRIVREWNERYAFPKLIIATSTQFFRYMEQTYGAEFPHYAGDWTDWWMDGPASSAYETGITRVAHEELASAEKLLSLSAAMGSEGYPEDQIEEAYDQLMLYDEHTWGMWNNVSDPYLETTTSEWQTKAAFATNAVELTHGLLRQGLQRFAGHFRTGTSPAIAVFNPLSWRRSAPVTARLDSVIEAGEIFRLLDPTGREVAYQVLESHQGGGLTIGFLAQDVPSYGYSLYTIDSGTAPRVGQASVSVQGNAIENRYYRVTLDPATGAVASIYDKELGRELVDGDSPFQLNQLVYDSGEPPIHGRFVPECSGVYAGQSGPVWGSITSLGKCAMGKHVRLSDPHWGKGRLAPYVIPWLRQEVILYQDLKRIDLVNRLYKEETLEKEGLYFAFPLLVPQARFTLEVAGAAAMQPGVDQLPDTCHDWHNLDYWLDASGPDYGVTWSSREVPVVSIGDINTGKWQSHLDLAGGQFFAYAMNNYWTTNFRERQGGDFVFRFSLVGHGPDWGKTEAARFGWSYCTDMPAIVLPAGQAGSREGGAGTFLEVEPENVMAFTLKRAEAGEGLIVRLIELEGRDTTVRLRLPAARIVSARRTDIVERDLGALSLRDGAIEVPIAAFGIETIRLGLQ